MQTIDFVILAIYAVAIFGLAQWVSRDRGGHEKTSTDYFLASKALPWWPWARRFWSRWSRRGRRRSTS